MNLMLEGQVVIVTGASAGIGRATAELLAQEGAQVVAAARGPMEVEEDRIEAVRVDLTEPAGPQQLTEHALALHGRVDALVNNVGGVVSHDGFLEIDDDSWAGTLELNLLTAVRCSRAAIPTLLERGGSIVHVSSEAGRLPDPGILDYAVAKAGLRMLSKGLAREFGARGVRSNVVAPGPTRTRLWDEQGGFVDQLAARFEMEREEAVTHFVRDVRGLVTGRVGTPEEVARVIAMLVSPLSAQVTGAEWAVDGGVLREI
jgi:NAD(P)-dependent dehydrogenase (short-subunit alcohol dehydrogenase family)